MGILSENIKINSDGNIPKYFKQNSFNMFKKYKNPDDTCKSVAISDITNGKFYLLFYADESNWMNYSPIYVCDIRGMKMIFAINFNFIPIEIREQIFDKYIVDLEDNEQLAGVNFERAYKELIRYGFEYAIVEYDIKRIKAVLQIDISLLPEFLYSTYPSIKYDPNNLYKIWLAKLKTREDRHQEMINTIVSDFYEAKDTLINEMSVLKGHFQRLKRNNDKF